MRPTRIFKPLSQLNEDEVVAQLQGMLFGFLTGVGLCTLLVFLS